MSHSGLESLTVGRAAFRLRALEDASLPPWLGSTLRGSLGHALRRLACLPLCRDADTCVIRERCAYAVCFETPLPRDATKLRGYSRIPHPFLLEPPLENDGSWPAGSLLEFHLLLVGKAVEHFPFLVAAVHQMAQEGLGVRRAKFELEAADSAGPGRSRALWRPDRRIEALPAFPVLKGSEVPCAERVGVRFVTPVRLTENGRVTSDLRFRVLARAVLDRLSSLLFFHCGEELDADFRGLLRRAEEVRLLESDLVVRRLSRWSNRLGEKLRLDGVVGRAVFEGEAVPALAPYLAAGEVLHVGKGTVFGLGRYEIESGATGGSWGGRAGRPKEGR